MEQTIIRNLATRLVKLRSEIIDRYPFYGRLLMHLNITLEKCGTAYTDMEKIVFDPQFANNLSDTELRFVMMHEVMHCVLKHCTRGAGKLPLIYNIACDIVVNSFLLEELQFEELSIDGSAVMHRLPNGMEGRLYTAEYVYGKLLKNSQEKLNEIYENGLLDNHDVWEKLKADDMLGHSWDKFVRDTVATCGSGFWRRLTRTGDFAVGIEKVDWKTVLHDFIQHDRCDYLFSIPDRRFQSEYILPSFSENVDGYKAENLWFVVDTSGSVSVAGVGQALYEVQMAMEQIGNLSGSLSFFDSDVSDPISFETVEELKNISPVGGGGTSFKAIFEKLESMKDDFEPVTIIIATDGYASFPQENVAMNIPVIWVVIDSTVEPPWGTTVHITTKIED